MLKHLMALPPGLDMRQKEQRHREAKGDVKVARPWPYDFRAKVIEPKGGRDQHRVEGEHDDAGGAVFLGAPGAANMKREQGAEQHQGHHRGTAMDHQEIGGAFLPEFSVESVLQLVGNEPGCAAAASNLRPIIQA